MAANAKRSASPARTNGHSNGHSNGHPNGHNGKLGKNDHASTRNTPLEHAARASSLLLTGFTVALVLLASLALAPMAPQPTLKLKLGTHAFVELDAAPFALLNDSAAVMSTLRSAADAGGLTVVSEQLHEFPVMGVSAVLLVSESHLSIHTWPEHGAAAVDLFTCGEAVLPCEPSAAAEYDAERGWACVGALPLLGRLGVRRATPMRDAPAGFWRGVTALVHGLGARRARVHWMERGLADRGPGTIPHAPAHK